jgi:hypothetical protein
LPFSTRAGRRRNRRGSAACPGGGFHSGGAAIAGGAPAPASLLYYAALLARWCSMPAWHGGAVLDGGITGASGMQRLAAAPVPSLLWVSCWPSGDCTCCLPSVPARQGSWAVDYPGLFAHAWRNIIALAEAALFTVLFWALLALWQILFVRLGFDFFRELFIKPWFFYPVTALTFGTALHLIGSIDRMVSAVLEQILNVFKWLAVIAGLLLALFSVACCRACRRCSARAIAPLAPSGCCG